MTVHASTDSFELGDYVGLIRRRMWIVLAFTCAGLLLSAAYTVVHHKTYTATASVFVNVNAANATELVGGRTSGAINMDNEAQIVQSDTVASLVAKNLGKVTSLATLIKQVSVAVPANTTVLQISCSQGSPARAAKCAQDFANSYLISRQNTAQVKISTDLQQEQSRAAPLEAQLVALENKINALPASSPKLTADHAQLENISSQLGPLRSTIASLGASTNYNAGYIITNAVPPTSPSSPRKLLYLPAGLMAGLLIGLIAAFAVERRDDRIHAARDLPRFLDVPVLFSTSDGSRLHVSVAPARSRAGQAFTELAQTLAASLGDGNHVLLVAGASAGPGVSIVAANLAATLARVRGDVMLVCADLDYSLSPQLLGLGNGRGLAEVITGAAAIDEVATPSPDRPRLRVIRPGLDQATALRQVQYDSSRRLVASLRGEVRYVVLEVAGTSDGADTLSLAEFADAALIVAEVGKTERSEVASCVRRLDHLRTEILGAAVLPGLGRAARTAGRSAAPAQPGRAARREPSSNGSAETRRPDQVREQRQEEVGARSRAESSAEQSGKGL
jgi:capsular polysaccharide biosynthesis protein/Mrp family chromosome partitioning ATPase